MKGRILEIYQFTKTQLEQEQSRAIEEAVQTAQAEVIIPHCQDLENEKQSRIATIEQSYEDQKRKYTDKVESEVRETVAKQFAVEIADIERKINTEA